MRCECKFSKPADYNDGNSTGFSCDKSDNSADMNDNGYTSDYTLSDLF